ncbi:hypothetical protein L1987_77587 [Smallanthus sonchifolius]|uniref:Uncharacterized protein n=1 Tax=Smallanthus sonchifolius TaxID=185202 RepID=A0ACB8Z9F5_9ASTR|nr:hypothetical protein L1987_77587 [Smallanthus sonchifolius]
MATSNLDRLIVHFPHSDVGYRNLSEIQDQCKSSSQPSLAIDIDIDGQDNPKTPRSVEHRIPVTATCPPAPRKAKRIPTTGKQRASCFPVVGVPADFKVYMDAMLALNETVYVPDIVIGDLGAGDHVKRLKLLTPPAHEA